MACFPLAWESFLGRSPNVSNMDHQQVKVVVWNENLHEKTDERVGRVYPEGIHGAIAGYLREQPGLEVKVATLDQPEHGLTPSTLEWADVLVWWGHAAHDQVADHVVERVHERVLDGMGLVVLHSGHASKVFRKLMGTSCCLKWREVGEKQNVWVVDPYHPIAAGVEDGLIEIPSCEMYGEPFDVPRPDDVVFISWYEGGEVFRSGLTWHRGRGKVFYFQPGHETYPIYHQKEVLHVIANAVRWAKFAGTRETTGIGACTHVGFSLEPIRKRE
ncbi:MAG: trehalose utilization protein ThuA [Promethearchaeota archaeon]